jgi:type VI secretion system secreted protein VgrG
MPDLMPYSQEGRLISLVTPLGDDVLLLAGFSGHEAMSRLFSFHLDLLYYKSGISTYIEFTDIVGKNVTITVNQSDGSDRYFNGIVSRFAQSGEDTNFVHYQMEMVPWTWLLTRFSDCRIFHNKSVSDIIQQVISDRGFTDVKLNLSGTYSPLEYCVQYRETDFNFISRLMEQNGIFYYFEHESGKHTMVITDASNSLSACPDLDEAVSLDSTQGGVGLDDLVTSFQIEQELHSGKYSLTDYYFETPSTNMAASESTVYEVDNNTSFELFDFPGEYTTRSDGTTAAKLRMGELEAGHLVARGSGSCRAFTTGYTFELQDHPNDDLNDTYVLTEIHHVASAVAGYTGGKAEDHYSNNFACISSKISFRPARLTPKPFVQGPQSATVVGKSGDEITVDKYGRVTVLFPWDRKNANSCWVRVSQDWAGQGWGAITIPRIGQEVLVSFLEGDPDRPIITGRVYNANQTVPYTLPDNQTVSTFMTRSSKGGSASTYNELRFEDKMGSEQVFFRSQKDFDNYVVNDTREWIGNNRSLTVTKDQMETVGGDRHEQIAGKNLVEIGGDRNEKVGGKEIISIGSDRNENVGGKEVINIGSTRDVNVSSTESINIGSDRNDNIGSNLNLNVGANISIQAGANLYEKSGANFAHEAGAIIHLKAGASMILEAGAELCLKVGGNFIDINSAGVFITGTMVFINSGGAAGSGPGSSPTSPSSPSSPGSTTDPTKPDKADDGSKFTKLS